MAAIPTRVQAEEHVVYEIEAMCRAAARYAEEWGATVNMATPAGYQDAVFFLEAALLHARTLVMAFGYPDKRARRLVKALGVKKGHEKSFRDGFSHPTASSSKAYGQLSELMAHIGETRWEVPLEVHVHQPIEVAYSVLDALEACGATQNPVLKAAVDQERQVLTDAV